MEVRTVRLVDPPTEDGYPNEPDRLRFESVMWIRISWVRIQVLVRPRLKYIYQKYKNLIPHFFSSSSSFNAPKNEFLCFVWSYYSCGYNKIVNSIVQNEILRWFLSILIWVFSDFGCFFSGTYEVRFNWIVFPAIFILKSWFPSPKFPSPSPLLQLIFFLTALRL